jgi:hypothetical protein
MRMKMFAAESMEAAKAMIFAEMGSDAVILSEREVEGGVEVRAAIDRMGAAAVNNEPVFLRDSRSGGHGRGVDNPMFARVRDALLWHGAPQRFAERVAQEGAGRLPGQFTSPEEAMAEGLGRLITCDPIPARLDRDILLVGPPGHGRTATAAKLTRRASVARAEITPLAADLDGSGAGAQLAAYLELERDRSASPKRRMPCSARCARCATKTAAASSTCRPSIPSKATISPALPIWWPRSALSRFSSSPPKVTPKTSPKLLAPSTAPAFAAPFSPNSTWSAAGAAPSRH